MRALCLALIVFILGLPGCRNPSFGRPVDVEAMCYEPERYVGDTSADFCAMMDFLVVDRQGDCWWFGSDCIPDGWTFCEDLKIKSPCCEVDVSSVAVCTPNDLD